MDKPTIPEPIIVAQFFKNRRKDIIRATLKTYEGTPLIDLRQFYTDKEGKVQPSGKGIAVHVRRLPELLDALRKAHAKAIELGLIGNAEAEQ